MQAYPFQMWKRGVRESMNGSSRGEPRVNFLSLGGRAADIISHEDAVGDANGWYSVDIARKGCLRQ